MRKSNRFPFRAWELTMYARTFTLAMVLIGVGLTATAFAAKVEVARSKFNEVQTRYDETKRAVDASNSNAAKPAATALMQTAASTCIAINDIYTDLTDMPSLHALWVKAKEMCMLLTTSAKTLTDKVGEGDPSREMSKVTEDFLKFGESLKVAQDKSKEFGVRWQAICDTCR